MRHFWWISNNVTDFIVRNRKCLQKSCAKFDWKIMVKYSNFLRNNCDATHASSERFERSQKFQDLFFTQPFAEDLLHIGIFHIRISIHVLVSIKCFRWKCWSSNLRKFQSKAWKKNKSLARKFKNHNKAPMLQ